jgi:hypothetical protein
MAVAAKGARSGGRWLENNDGDGYNGEDGMMRDTAIRAATEVGQGRSAFSKVRRGGSTVAELGRGVSTVVGLRR